MARHPRHRNPSNGRNRNPSDSDEEDSDFSFESDSHDAPPIAADQIAYLDLIQLAEAPPERPRPLPHRRDRDVVLKWESMEEDDKKWIDAHRDDPDDADVTAGECRTLEPSPVITLPLLRFQKEFLFWARNQEQSEARGGILADEMGMGKTIQAISMVLTARDRNLRSRDQEPESLSLKNVGATLVICPVVAVIQWVGEIERYTEQGSARVLVYHGAKRAKCGYNFDDYDFVITTYSTMEYDYRKNVMPLGRRCEYCGKRFRKKRLETHLRYYCGPFARRTVAQAKTQKKKEVDELKGMVKGGKTKEKKVDGGSEDTGEGVRGVSLLHSVKWDRIILDEAHSIKDRSSNTAKAVFALDSHYRWALSGTPLQNRVGELYSLVR